MVNTIIAITNGNSISAQPILIKLKPAFCIFELILNFVLQCLHISALVLTSSLHFGQIFILLVLIDKQKDDMFCLYSPITGVYKQILSSLSVMVFPIFYF